MKDKKKILIIVGILLFAIACAVAIMCYFRSSNSGTNNNSKIEVNSEPINKRVIELESETFDFDNTTSFATDSWETIAENIKNGNTSMYHVGDMKLITISAHDNDKYFISCQQNLDNKFSDDIECGYETVEMSEVQVIVRIANLSNPSECAQQGFSQTACGFVVEFVDSIDYYVYNDIPEDIDDYAENYFDEDIGYSTGGYTSSELYKYINNNIYNALPNYLRDVIIDTFTVTGHPNDNKSNFESNEKIYLLSAHEIYSYVDDNLPDDLYTPLNEDDTSWNFTRQLDYYFEKGVTTDSYEAAKKVSGDWWLRSTTKYGNQTFFYVDEDGDLCGDDPADKKGLSLAFRVG